MSCALAVEHVRGAMRVDDFEDAVWAIDSIRVVVRARRSSPVGDFNWDNAAPGTQRLTAYTNRRIQARVGALEFSVIDGHGGEPHGRMLLRTLRQTYR